MKTLITMIISIFILFGGVRFIHAEIDSNSALIIIDVQKKYSEPFGGTARVCPKQADSIIGVINKMVDLFSAKQTDIIYILQKGMNNPLDNRLKDVGDLKFIKEESSSFSNMDFNKYLLFKGIKRLYITGLAAEYCVNATIQDALRKGYGVTAISDGIAALSCSKLEETLQTYEKKGVKVIPSIEIITE